MRNKNTIRIAMLGVILTGGFLFMRSAGPASSKTKPCKQSMDQCCKKNGAGKMIWENLSQQFFSSI